MSSFGAEENLSEFEVVSFFSNTLASSESNHETQQNVVYLVGGQNKLGCSTNFVCEFNLKNMQALDADWKLPSGIRSFSVAQAGNQAFLGGGLSESGVSNQVMLVKF